MRLVILIKTILFTVKEEIIKTQTDTNTVINLDTDTVLDAHLHSEVTSFILLSKFYDTCQQKSVQNIFFCFPGRSEKDKKDILNRVLLACIIEI